MPKRLYNLRNIDGAIFPFNEATDNAPSHISLVEASWDLEKELAKHIPQNKSGFLYYISAEEMEEFEKYWNSRNAGR